MPVYCGRRCSCSTMGPAALYSTCVRQGLTHTRGQNDQMFPACNTPRPAVVGVVRKNCFLLVLASGWVHPCLLDYLLTHACVIMCVSCANCLSCKNVVAQPPQVLWLPRLRVVRSCSVRLRFAASPRCAQCVVCACYVIHLPLQVEKLVVQDTLSLACGCQTLPSGIR